MLEVSREIKKALVEMDCNEDLNPLNEDIVITQELRKEVDDLDLDLIIVLKKRLKNSEVKFKFKKKNNRIRRARGTCNIEVIKLENPDFADWDPNYIPMGCSNPNIVRFYDLDKKLWRSCDVSRLMLIIDK